jgi:DsbC/DsbD-like thiol-disulfide interchange protein
MISKLLTVAALAAITLAMPARAQSVGDLMKVEFLPGWKTDSGTLMGGVRLQLAGGWKTYWRSPGDAGIPPEFDWSGSENLKSVRIHWPKPEVFDFNGMRTIGYTSEVVLPIEIWPERAGDPVEVQAHVDLGICRDICVPASFEFSSRMAQGSKAVPEISRSLKARPKTPHEAGVTNHECRVDAGARGLIVELNIDMPQLGSDEMVVIETADPTIWVSEAQVRRDGRSLVATADLVSPSRKPFILDRSGLRVTVLAVGTAVEISGCPAP